MAVSYIITVLDDDHLEVITEQQIEDAYPDSSLPMTVMEAINNVLDRRSEQNEIREKMSREQINKLIEERRAEMLTHVREYNALMQYLDKGAKE